MEEYAQYLTTEVQAKFTQIIIAMQNLGYRLKRDKTKYPAWSFVHPKVKKAILRCAIEKGKPILKMKYYASCEYSFFFKEALRAAIEEFNYQNTGCFGCGYCGGVEGYHYLYPDGREYYRCGKELIDIRNLDALPVKETMALIQKQHEFFLARLAS